jgi:outer membrane protein
MKFNSMTTAAAALLLTVGVPAAMTQSGGTPPAPAPAAAAVKMGVLDVRQAITSTAEGKLASAELQSQFTPRQAELENLNKRIEDLRTRIQQGRNTLSQEELVRLQREGESLARTLDRRRNDLQEDVQAAENEVLERIGGKMRQVLDRYARENAFTVIFDISTQSGIVYAANSVDVTQDIIRLYDQAHPVKASAQPAAPRPQPGTPASKPPTKPPQ